MTRLARFHCSIIVIVCSGSVSQTPPTPPVRSVDLSDLPDDGPLGELGSTIVRFSIFCIIVDINSHFAILHTVLRSTVYQWFELGQQLGLDDLILAKIKKENRESQNCMLDMLATWLDGKGGECTKQALVKALLSIDCRINDGIVGKHAIKKMCLIHY